MEQQREEQARKLQRLQCAVQNYDWGLPASASRVASLHALNAGASLDPRNPYAELWMGTHDSGPCYLKNNSNANSSNYHSEKNNGPAAPTTLKSWLLQNPCVLGERVLVNWGCDLPFLFKVLSVGKALSIQAHPDKELARALHKRLPDIYKDANHKPEMALALTQFEALCGFVSLEDLKDVVAGVPEVAELIGNRNKDQVLNFNVKHGQEKFKPVLQEAFTRLMSADKDLVAEVVSKVKCRLQSEIQLRELKERELLVLRLEEQYPGDVGVISAFFLNYVRLKPGEALYLGANEPHAYLSGECVECMAASDNVVRAGLTPKLRDVPTLCSMLTYKQGHPEILRGVSVNPYIKKYLPPFDEFEVDSCALPQGASTAFPAVPGPSIFLVMAGQGTIEADSLREEIAEGDVFFVAADCEILLTAETQLQIFRAGVSSKFLYRQ
uniref:Mannose-6-phosphate isomerase n=1 Tax=Kalanchoe fedtschenkoi TaxID=63787 RepID=A0A7N0SZV4_KALFE